MLTAATIVLNYLLGWALLSWLKFSGGRMEFIGLSFPIGLGASTVIVILLDVLGIPLYRWLVLPVLLLTVLLLLYFARSEIREALPVFWDRRAWRPHRRHPVEVVVTGLLGIIFVASAWRCYFFPVTPYDSIVGIDLVAKYAVMFGRIDSPMFTDLGPILSTQPYYAPFTALAQILYRLAGLAYGKIWLSFMFLSLMLTLYAHLRARLHPVLAGLLILMLAITPELYAYTLLLQTDFANAVFVSLGIIYLFVYLQTERQSHFLVGALLLGFGAWSRSETVAFVVVAAALLAVFCRWEQDRSTVESLKRGSLAFLPAFFFFAIWNLYYLPAVLDYHPESVFKFGFWDTERMWLLALGIYRVLTSLDHWGYILIVFLTVAAANLLFFRDKRNLFILLWIFLFIAAFWVLLYHLQFSVKANINNTFRRGAFKIWPVMIYYIGTSALLERLSQALFRWENTGRFFGKGDSDA